MTRKDYVKFAALFNGEMTLRQQDWAKRMLIRGMVLSTADIFAQDNPRFDRERFYVASGLSVNGELI